MNARGPRTTVLFVDAIDDGVARLLLGEEAITLPARLLPAGTREGDWIELGARVVTPPPDDTEARRRKLASDDPGGDIDL